MALEEVTSCISTVHSAGC